MADAKHFTVHIARVVVLLAVVVGIGWFAISLLYDDEQPRSQTDEGPASVGPLMDVVSKFYADHRRFPRPGADLEDYGIAAEPHVAKARVSPDDMVITITYKGRREIDGKTLTLTPYVDGHGDLKWRCALPDIEPRWWPDYCRPHSTP
ncbi:MAG: pilin [Chloroflexota bacterium]